jgi:hypothetical protein
MADYRLVVRAGAVWKFKNVYICESYLLSIPPRERKWREIKNNSAK